MPLTSRGQGFTGARNALALHGRPWYRLPNTPLVHRDALRRLAGPLCPNLQVKHRRQRCASTGLYFTERPCAHTHMGGPGWGNAQCGLAPQKSCACGPPFPWGGRGWCAKRVQDVYYLCTRLTQRPQTAPHKASCAHRRELNPRARETCAEGNPPQETGGGINEAVNQQNRAGSGSPGMTQAPTGTLGRSVGYRPVCSRCEFAQANIL